MYDCDDVSYKVVQFQIHVALFRNIKLGLKHETVLEAFMTIFRNDHRGDASKRNHFYRNFYTAESLLSSRATTIFMA